jgi:hypothetical protein
MQNSELSLHDLEPGPLPRLMVDDPEFLDGVDHLERGLAPGFRRAAPEFLHPAHEETPATAGNFEASSVARAVVLSGGFILLMLVGAAASAFVFADRFARLVGQ